MPKFATLGQTFEFRLRFDDFDPATDTAKMHLRSSTGRLDFTATDNGDGYFKFYDAALAANSGTLLGDTEYVIIVTSGSDKLPVAEGMVHVRADPSTAANTDLRTTTKTILDAIQATLAGNASLDQLSYTISTNAGTRSLSRLPRDELIRLENVYRQRYRREKRGAARRSGKKGGNQVKARFSRRG